MATIRKLTDGEMYSTTNKEPVKCAVCKRDAEYQKVGVMEGEVEVCGVCKGRPVWKVRGMKHTVLASGTQGKRRGKAI